MSFTVAERTRVLAENSSSRLRVAAFPGADDAELPAGATELLLWGHDAQLRAGDRLAFVQGSFAQIVTLAADAAPARRCRAGWRARQRPSTRSPTRRPGSRGCSGRSRSRKPCGRGARSRSRCTPTSSTLATGRRATPSTRPSAEPRRGELAIQLTRRTSIVTRRRRGDGYLLRALRVPEWPVVHDGDGTGASVPAVQVAISDETWTRVEHLHGSRSYDLHYTAEADEEGAVWLRFGDGVNGREVALETPDRPAAKIELSYRIGDPVAGNVGLGTLVEIVAPITGPTSRQRSTPSAPSR